ncbi:hypothetical protein B0H13DRAFT_2345088 [Mycena leptocephala]|nr:hypothetical protein B0H13DRAFT_2345088 [Mycena leptocephala]
MLAYAWRSAHQAASRAPTVVIFPLLRLLPSPAAASRCPPACPRRPCTLPRLPIGPYASNTARRLDCPRATPPLWVAIHTPQVTPFRASASAAGLAAAPPAHLLLNRRVLPVRVRASPVTSLARAPCSFPASAGIASRSFPLLRLHCTRFPVPPAPLRSTPRSASLALQSPLPHSSHPPHQFTLGHVSYMLLIHFGLLGCCTPMFFM